jgi:GntR family transcriptional regulator/MocR family aminotransferase
LNIAGTIGPVKIYLGTFSKTMFPALRAGWVVVPKSLVEHFSVAIRNTGHGVPAVVQAALADFIDEGHFATHVRRMRGLYAKRQAVFVAAAERHLQGRLVVAPADAGMQIAARLPARGDDRALSAALEEAGVVAPALSAYALGRPPVRGLFLGYAGVPEREIVGAMHTLGRMLARRG